MPRKLLDLRMPRPALETFVKTTRSLAHIADKLTAPRLGFLTRPPFVIGVALVCTIAALVTFPLGLIPLGPVLPGISILLMGIGLTARDGVFLLLSTLAMAGAVLLVVRWLT
ncbi:MAG: exopolysaccharide biosynthesis protein, partial [Myxococcota bacterium]